MKTIRSIALSLVFALMISLPLFGQDSKITPPKETGVYIKTSKGMKRLMPNIIFDERGILYVEANNPPHFLLKDVEYFILYGKYNLEVLTMNPMTFLGQSPLGKQRFLFGKNIDFDLKKRGNDLHTIKPKGLLGRGYYSIWINDTAWDFVLD